VTSKYSLVYCRRSPRRDRKCFPPRQTPRQLALERPPVIQSDLSSTIHIAPSRLVTKFCGSRVADSSCRISAEFYHIASFYRRHGGLSAGRRSRLGPGRCVRPTGDGVPRAAGDSVDAWLRDCRRRNCSAPRRPVEMRLRRHRGGRVSVLRNLVISAGLSCRLPAFS